MVALASEDLANLEQKPEQLLKELRILVIPPDPKELNEQRETIKDLEAKINSRRIKIKESGSLAEAVLKLSDFFSDADKAAGQYIENVLINEKESQRVLQEARSEAERIIAEAEKIKAQKIEEGNLYINKVKRIVSEYLEKQKRMKKPVGDEKSEENQENRSSAVGCSDAGNGVKTS